MDGFSATKNIRKTNLVVPIIALTATPIETIEQDCKVVGMDGIIPKPLKKEVLKKELDKWFLTIPFSSQLFGYSIENLNTQLSTLNLSGKDPNSN